VEVLDVVVGAVVGVEVLVVDAVEIVRRTRGFL
jgi:hypothetical protein